MIRRDYSKLIKRAIASFLILTSITTISCNKEGEDYMKDYDDYLKNHVKADDFCTLIKSTYYIYAYQVGCPPCGYLRDLVFETLDKKLENFYIYDASNSKKEDKGKFKKKDENSSIDEMAEKMIGAKSTSEIYMIVTPSLYVFQKNTLTKFLHEVYSIEDTLKEIGDVSKR